MHVMSRKKRRAMHRSKREKRRKEAQAGSTNW
jgi:hypothetical protein